MTKFKSYNKEKNGEIVDKKAFLFGLMSVRSEEHTSELQSQR